MVSDKTTRRRGKLKNVLGWLTADRRVEARGKVEAETGRAPRPAEQAQAEKEVRIAQGDIDQDDVR